MQHDTMQQQQYATEFNFHQSLFSLECRDKLPYIRVMTSYSGIKAAMPRLHCIRRPKQSVCHVKVIIPYLNRKEWLLIGTTWEHPSNLCPFEVQYQIVCFRREKLCYYLSEQTRYFMWSSKRQSSYLSYAISELLIM